jgi:hypothetical protein
MVAPASPGRSQGYEPVQLKLPGAEALPLAVNPKVGESSVEEKAAATVETSFEAFRSPQDL